MNEDSKANQARKGLFDSVKGKAKEVAGAVTGNDSLTAEGQLEQTQAQCIRLLEILREQSRFALRTTKEQGVLPHAQAIRVQIGGLRGIQMALDDHATEQKIDDVNGLVSQAISEFDDLKQLPFPLIMQQIAAYKGRRRISRKG